MRTLLLLALVFLPQGAASAQSLRLKAGLTSTRLLETAAPYAGGSALGWTVGGDLQFGSLISVAPGAHLQQLAFTLLDGTTNREDNITLRAVQVPLTLGVGVDLKLVSLRAFAGPTLTFVRGVGDNDAGIRREDVRTPLLGGTVGLEGNVLFLSGFIARDRTISALFRGTTDYRYGEGALTVTRIGLGLRF